jgi:uncharacterized protein YbjT (DUF2867 family)
MHEIHVTVVSAEEAEYGTAEPTGSSPSTETKGRSMKIVVIGGHGRIGSKIVEKLGEHGHDAVAADLSTGVNTLTGKGLAEAFDGADVVVDVSNSPSFEDDAVMDFFRTSTRNILLAEHAARVGHHVALSIVGSDRLPESGYLRAKIAQEELIEASSIPYTIVRSTQFYEFVDSIADAATEGDTVRVPAASIQPIAAEDAAGIVGRLAAGRPLNRIVEIGGPRPYRFDELIGYALSAHEDSRRVVADPDTRYFGTTLTNGSLLPGENAQLGETRFEDWLDARERDRIDAGLAAA